MRKKNLKKYIFNSLAVGRWEKDEFVIMNTLSKKKYSFDFPMYNLILYLSKASSINSIVEKVMEEFDSDREISKKFVQDLLEKEIIVDEKTNKYEGWLDRNWRNALYFHLLTRDCEFIDMGQKDEFSVKTNVLKSYLKDSPFPEFYKSYKGKYLSLPEPKMEFVSAGETILNRRTTRRFGETPLTLEQLSTILYYTCQPAKKIRDYAENKKKDNPMILVLSAYTPYEIYFTNNNIPELEKGLYHYNMKSHEIFLIKKGEYKRKMKEISIGQMGVEDASVVFMISSIFSRYMWRYRNSRAYRNLLIECASFAHRIALITEGIGLRHFLSPAMRDSMADQLFGLDGVDETFTYLVSVGNKYIKK